MAKPFFIDDHVRIALSDAVGWARDHPLSWEQLQGHVPDKQQTFELKLTDRRPEDLNWRPPTREIKLPFKWRLCVSCEEQPAGLMLHISLSSPTPKKTVPRPEAIKMLTEEMEKLGLIPLDAASRVWIEEYTDGSGQFEGRAVNVVWLLREASHASAS